MPSEFMRLFYDSEALDEPEPVPAKRGRKRTYRYRGFLEPRRAARERDQHRCQDCGAATWLHVHHVVPVSRGGTHEIDNLVTLCVTCHKTRHPSLSRIIGKGVTGGAL